MTQFEIKGKLNEQQEKGLEIIKKDVLGVFDEGTGVQSVLNNVVFDFLNYIAVFPVENEHHFSSKKGNVLPDSYLLAPGSTALDLAYTIHSDIGNSFIGAIDCKTGKKIGKDSKLKNRSRLWKSSLNFDLSFCIWTFAI